MSLGTSDVIKIAELARLAIREEEIPNYARDLSAILDMVEEMRNADTSGVAPMFHPLDIAQRLRTDTVSEVNQRDTFQSIAPQVEAGLYLVPKVLE